MTEPGAKGLTIFNFNGENGGVTNWDILRRGVDLLEKTDRFKTVVIDTVERAYDQCLEYVSKKLGIVHPGDVDDFGKSWSAVRKEFSGQLTRLINTGRGIIFTAHTSREDINRRSGESFAIIEPKLSKIAKTEVGSIVDNQFYVSHAKDMKGSDIRIIFTSPDELVVAGSRPINGITLPTILPLTKTNGYEMFLEAAIGKYKGLDPQTLMAAQDASNSNKKLIRSVKRKDQENTTN